MKNRKWMYVLGSILVGLAFARPAELKACSCLPPPPPAEAFEEVDAVLLGTVTSFERSGEHYRAAQVRVTKLWKGPPAFTIEILTLLNSAACGFDFETGKAYVIYARNNGEGHLSTILCDRTALTENASEDLSFLEGVEPIIDTGGKGCCGGPVSTGDALLAGGFLVYLFKRRFKDVG